MAPDRGRPPLPVVGVTHGYTSFMDWGFFPPLSEALAEVGIASLRFHFSDSSIGADLCTMTEPERFRRNGDLHELDEDGLFREISEGVYTVTAKGDEHAKGLLAQPDGRPRQ